MIKCPNCKSEYYTVLYIDEYDGEDDKVYRISKVKCDDCESRFYITETFKFVSDENLGDYCV